MFSTLASLAIVGFGGIAGGALPYADGVFVPPAPAKETNACPLPREALERCLGRIERFYEFTMFEDQGERLRQEAAERSGGALKGGEVVDLDLAGTGLFVEPQALETGWAFLAAVASAGAEAVRLRVDLGSLQSDRTVWVVDPVSLRAFGPCVFDPDAPAERWLATIHGDTAVLFVLGPTPDMPALRLTGFGHIFLPFRTVAKELDCNLDISCETDPAILRASTAVAIILVGGSWFCSGCLVNNERTVALEPFFITANHCICTNAQAAATELYWDYRTSACGLDDAPETETLPRSYGDALLATDPSLDATLIRLLDVPTGPEGRAYVGWDSRKAVADEAVLTIHYPDAAHMRISKGAVVSVDDVVNVRRHQTRVLWAEGVTEKGSSGAPLLFASNLRLAGALSQGPQHSCGEDRSGNLDWFSSFHEFYDQVDQYLDADVPSTAAGRDDCDSSTISCPFVLAYQQEPAKLEAWRGARDKLLARHPAAGGTIVRTYYAVAPYAAAVLDDAPLPRALFRLVLAPFAPSACRGHHA